MTGRASDTTQGGRSRSTALTLALIILAVLATAFWRANPVTGQAERYAATIAATSAGVYITLRTLNAFLSTAQEVEVGGAFVVSGTAQPLKILEPVDDTIERVAQVVFMVMVVTSVLSVAMAPASALGWGLLALGGLLALFQHRWPLAVTGPLIRLGLLLALVAPLAFVLADLMAEPMTRAVWDAEAARVAEITAPVAPDLGVSGGVPEGWLARAQEAWGEVERYQQLAAQIYARADELIGSLISLAAVILFRLFVLPTLLLLGLWALVVRSASPRA